MQSHLEQKNPTDNILKQATDFVIHQTDLTPKTIQQNYLSQLKNLKEKQELIQHLRDELLKALSYERTHQKYKNKKLQKKNYDRIYNTLIHLSKAWPLNEIENGRAICPITAESLDSNNAITLSSGHRFDITCWKKTSFERKNPVTQESFSDRDEQRIARRMHEKGIVRDSERRDRQYWQFLLSFMIMVCGIAGTLLFLVDPDPRPAIIFFTLAGIVTAIGCYGFREDISNIIRHAIQRLTPITEPNEEDVNLELEIQITPSSHFVTDQKQEITIKKSEVKNEDYCRNNLTFFGQLPNAISPDLENPLTSDPNSAIELRTTNTSVNTRLFPNF